jgi:hypothetical protein
VDAKGQNKGFLLGAALVIRGSRPCLRPRLLALLTLLTLLTLLGPRLLLLASRLDRLWEKLQVCVVCVCVCVCVCVRVCVIRHSTSYNAPVRVCSHVCQCCVCLWLVRSCVSLCYSFRIALREKTFVIRILYDFKSYVSKTLL